MVFLSIDSPILPQPKKKRSPPWPTSPKMPPKSFTAEQCGLRA